MTKRAEKTTCSGVFSRPRRRHTNLSPNLLPARVRKSAGARGNRRPLTAVNIALTMFRQGIVMNRDELMRVREWADSKLATGDEPPWAWYRYMQLREALDAILQGASATRPMESSPQPVKRPGACLRLVASVDQQDTAQLHHDHLREIPLPM